MNSVQLIGNLARDVEVKEFSTGKKVARFTVVTNEKYTANGEEKDLVSYVPCTAWGYLANIIGGATKGTKIFAEGKVHQRSYDKDGEKRYSTEVNVRNVAVLSANKPQESNFDTFESTTEEIPF